jgi:hypothetical protein
LTCGPLFNFAHLDRVLRLKEPASDQGCLSDLHRFATACICAATLAPIAITAVMHRPIRNSESDGVG